MCCVVPVVIVMCPVAKFGAKNGIPLFHGVSSPSRMFATHSINVGPTFKGSYLWAASCLDENLHDDHR